MNSAGSVLERESVTGGDTHAADALVQGMYVFSDWQVVDSWLRSNADIVGVLLEARGFLADCFGIQQPALLDVEVDPDLVNVSYLVVRAVCARETVDGALAKLRRFDEKFGLYCRPAIDGRILFTVSLC